MRTRILISVSILGLLLAASGSAQMVQAVKAKIDFAFTAKGKVLPAGQYTLTYDAPTDTIRVVGSAKGAEVLMPVETRLAGAMHTTPADSHVVFDKVGDKYFLSELWIPGNDGFLLYMTKGKHEHAVVNVPR